MKKIRMMLFILMAAGVCLAACQNKDSVKTQNIENETEIETENGGGGQQENLDGLTENKLEKKTIGISLLNNAHVFYNNIEAALKQKAEEFGWSLIIQDAAGDGNKQLNQVQDFITQKVDAVIICPTNSAGSKSMVELADQAKIPVFTMDVASDGAVVSHVSTDNYKGGQLAAEYMVNQILENKSGDVAVITYSEIESCVDRERGFVDWIKENALEVLVVDIQNYSGDQGKAAEVMQNMLLKHENLDGVFCVGDPAAVGAMASIQGAGSDVKIVGFDGNPEGIEAILSGSNWVADVAQDPESIGRKTMEAVMDYFLGNSVESVIPISPRIIDITNAATQDS